MKAYDGTIYPIYDSSKWPYLRYSKIIRKKIAKKKEKRKKARRKRVNEHKNKSCISRVDR